MIYEKSLKGSPRLNISELEDTSHSMRKDVTGLLASMKEVAWRIDDAENRARRNNHRFTGFPEDAE